MGPPCTPAARLALQAGSCCAAHCRSPCSSASPWHTILFSGGISPRDAKRNILSGGDAVYRSFAEFDEFLGDEDAWFTLSPARCAATTSMPGGIGQLFCDITGGAKFETSGVALDVSENGVATSRATIVAQQSRAIGDEALPELRMNKRHAGSKPCALRRNALKGKFDSLRHDESGIF
eukprot:6993256-Pyramimonas_sp.AAC.1